MNFATYPSLAGRAVFVSGGATGIGADIVRAFALNHAKVAFVDLQAEAGEAMAAEISGTGETALFFSLRRDRHCGASTDNRGGRREAWPHRGSGQQRRQRRTPQRFSEVSPDYWDQTQNVNLRHHFFAAQAVHPQMRALGFGSIVNLSSTAWRVGAAEMPAYSTAKAGVVELTRALARAFGDDNIRVNAIEPGAVMTDRQRRLWYRRRSRSRRWPGARLIRTTLIGEDVARMALFLGADDSRMITKQSIAVDAGLR